MAAPNSRERRNACYGDQFQPILTRGLTSSQRDISAASAYYHSDAIDQERATEAQNSDPSSVYLEHFEFPQQQPGGAFPRSNSGSSGSWEDDIVDEPQYFEHAPEPGTEASNDAKQTSIPDFSDEHIDSVLGLWERRTKSPTESRTSSAVEAFPALDPEPDHPGPYEGILHHNNTLPSFDTAPTSSFSSGTPKTPQRASSPSDTLHLSDYSPSSPVSRTFLPNSATLCRHRALPHQPTYSYTQLASQSFEDQHNPSPDVYKICLDTPPQPNSYERKPFLDFSSSHQSFGSENNQPPEPLCNPRDPDKRRKSNPKRGRGGNPLPSPHDFETLNKKNRFDPLSFIPGTEGRRNNPQESTVYSPPAFSSPFEKFPKTPTYPGESSSTQTGDIADDNDPIRKYAIPYSELPLESAPVKRKPRRSLRLAASLKRILTPKHKSTSNDDPTPVATPLPQQIQVNESPTDAEAAWFEGVIQRLQDECADQERYRDAMDSRHLDPSSAMVALTKQKAEAMRLAREQGAAVKEMCRRAKTDMPPYQFEELIGKGAYGRVYKGRQLPTQKPVAIKVLEIDTLDYKTVRDFRDESIKDFIRETNIMKQVKDAGAKNINMLIEAFSIHSQLWLICEHCPGGSVKTLMRATGDRLEERFIIPIARELAEGLRAIHDAGIIHRDVKAANVLIHEEGRLQICDFGVAGVLQSKVDKRSTWIGTPHWMPPEMFPNRGGGEMHQYGSEIDVWAYGCTLFECATGNPPNATLRERMQIGRQLNRFPPKLEGDTFSDSLRSLVAFSLDSDPKVRPTMQKILQHPYIADSTESHPTASLSELVKIYYQWVQRGGQRISLFNPGGAAAAEFPEAEDPLDREDWNFSTTAGFERRFSLIDLDQLSASLADLENDMIPTIPEPLGDYFDDNVDTDLSVEDKANFDERVKRGAAAMEGLFNEEKPGYTYETKNDFVPVQQEQRFSSDLPLRTDTDRSSVTSTFIDINLGVFDSAHYAAGSASNHPPFQLADADTIRANRSSSRLMRNSTTSSDSGEYQPQRGPRPPTMEWTFPSTMSGDTDDASHDDGPGPDFELTQQEKRDTRAWTFPVMTAEEDPPPEEPYEWADGIASSHHIEPDDEMTRKYPPLQRPSYSRPPGDGPPDSRPSTATSTHSTISDADNDPFRFDRPVTPPCEDVGNHTTSSSSSTTSSLDRFPSITDSVVYTDFDEGTDRSIHSYTEFHPPYQEENMMSGNGAFGGPSNSQNGRAEGADSDGDDEAETKSVAESDMAQLDFPQPVPPSMESMMEGASDDVVAQELDRLLGDFLHGLAVTGEALVRTDVGRGRWGVAGDSGGDSFRDNRPEQEQESDHDD